MLRVRLDGWTEIRDTMPTVIGLKAWTAGETPRPWALGSEGGDDDQSERDEQTENAHRRHPEEDTSTLAFLSEFRQVLLVPLQKLLVDVAVGVIPQLADLLAPELDHHAGALVHHVLGGALQPRAFADLDDHPVIGIVPFAPRVLVAPIGGAEARLA